MTAKETDIKALMERIYSLDKPVHPIDHLRIFADGTEKLDLSREDAGEIVDVIDAFAEALKPKDKQIEALKHAVEGECDGLAIDDAQARSILAYVLSAQDGAVGVKALEWEGDGHWSHGPDEGWMEEANTPFGWGYSIEFGRYDEGTFIVDSTFDTRLTGFETPEEAKAAAQADYEARIRSALTSQEAGAEPEPVESLDKRMEAAGMIPLSKLLAGDTPLSKWEAHAGVKDIDAFRQWVEMKHGEYMRMRLAYELGDKEKDDLYEWVFAHAGVFSQVAANLRQALACPPLDRGDEWEPSDEAIQAASARAITALPTGAIEAINREGPDGLRQAMSAILRAAAKGDGQ